MEFLARGKVKDIYTVDSDTLLFKFSDRVSAFDVKFNETIPHKGEVLCKFAEFWFDKLSTPNHFISRKSDTEILVKKMEMIPMECVVRGYFYGSLVNRWKENKITLSADTDTRLAAKLAKPLFDPTTKSKHDIPVNKATAQDLGLVTLQQYDWLEKTTIEIYQKMSALAEQAGFILADLKLEFGILDGTITLGDSIGPDEYRLWPKDSFKVGVTQEAYDKQLLRDWLAVNGYQKLFDAARANGKEPIPPQIPFDIISKMTSRYITAYQRFTGINPL